MDERDQFHASTEAQLSVGLPEEVVDENVADALLFESQA